MFECDVNELESESHSILGTSSILISSFVRNRPDKVVYQVPIGSMEFNSVKASLFCPNHSQLEVTFGVFDIFDCHFLRRKQVSVALMPLLIFIGNGGRTPYLLVVYFRWLG